MRKKANYGFPLNFLLMRIIISIMITIIFISIILVISAIIIGFLALIIALFIYVYFYIIKFRKKFDFEREKLVKNMIEIADMKGDETILDLGTGSGFLSINFAKNLGGGKVIGIDKYENKIGNPLQFFKINFIFNSKKYAKRNAIIENVADRCDFVKADLGKTLNFQDNYFDLIVASEFFYCFPNEKQKKLLDEINRTLKNKGKVIILEAKSFPRHKWNIKDVYHYFEKLGYENKVQKIKNRIILKCVKP